MSIMSIIRSLSSTTLAYLSSEKIYIYIKSQVKSNENIDKTAGESWEKFPPPHLDLVVFIKFGSVFLLQGHVIQ